MAGKKKTIISISVVNGVINLTSGPTARPIEGGHVRARPARRIRWERNVDNVIGIDDFDLSFQSFDIEEGAVVPDEDWPFIAHEAEPVGADVRPFKGTVTKATAFEGRVSADAGVYKYTVTARKGQNQYTLDPIIIVEK